MTSQGSAWPRLRRALDRGNLVEARSAASELEHVGLAEALELVLLIRDQMPAKFMRAALRWHARFCREARDIAPGEAVAVLALLEMLGRKEGEGGREGFGRARLGTRDGASLRGALALVGGAGGLAP